MYTFCVQLCRLFPRYSTVCLINGMQGSQSDVLGSLWRQYFLTTFMNLQICRACWDNNNREVIWWRVNLLLWVQNRPTNISLKLPDNEIGKPPSRGSKMIRKTKEPNYLPSVAKNKEYKKLESDGRLTFEKIGSQWLGDKKYRGLFKSNNHLIPNQYLCGVTWEGARAICPQNALYKM